ncbi:MAG: hypothetical protein AAB923_03225 [Patescibacteria group bacterium]
MADEPQSHAAGNQPASSSPDSVRADGSPVDQELARRVTALYERVDQMLKDVASEDRGEIEQNLMEAIAADLLARLSDQLSDNQKKQFAAMEKATGGKHDLNNIAAFFQSSFPREVIVKHLVEATDEVLQEFSDVMLEDRPEFLK